MLKLYDKFLPEPLLTIILHYLVRMEDSNYMLVDLCARLSYQESQTPQDLAMVDSLDSVWETCIGKIYGAPALAHYRTLEIPPKEYFFKSQEIAKLDVICEQLKKFNQHCPYYFNRSQEHADIYRFFVFSWDQENHLELRFENLELHKKQLEDVLEFQDQGNIINRVSMCGHDHLVEALLKRVNSPEQLRRTAIMVATSALAHRHPKVLKVALSHGADLGAAIDYFNFLNHVGGVIRNDPVLQEIGEILKNARSKFIGPLRFTNRHPEVSASAVVNQRDACLIS